MGCKVVSLKRIFADVVYHFQHDYDFFNDSNRISIHLESKQVGQVVKMPVLDQKV